MDQSKRVLLISRDLMIQRALAEALTLRGCQTFEGTERIESLRLMYETHPDLIFLEIDEPDDDWEFFARIRAITDTPAILAVNRNEPARARWSKRNTAILIKPISVARVMDKARAWGIVRRNAKSRVDPTWSTRRLRVVDLIRIDRALSQVGECGEVRLIVEHGQVRFLEKIATFPISNVTLSSAKHLAHQVGDSSLRSE